MYDAQGQDLATTIRPSGPISCSTETQKTKVKRLKPNANASKAGMEFAVEMEVLAHVRRRNLLGLRRY